MRRDPRERCRKKKIPLITVYYINTYTVSLLRQTETKSFIKVDGILTICYSQMISDELPHEVVLSIQRVLEIQSTEEVDRLDGLSEKFSAVEILNDFFPDGATSLHFSPAKYSLISRL